MSDRLSPWFLLLLGVAVAGGVLTVVATSQLSTTLLTVGVVLLVAGGWAVSLCLHEFGHAVVAFRGGDTTVRDKGYLTLDIRRYTDIGWSFVLPVIFLLIGGIPLPGGAVWINHGLLRSRAARSLVSLAGPLTNLVLAAVLTLAVATAAMPIGLAVGLSCLALIQIYAFVLNILPVPGLDGFGVIEPYLPYEAQRTAARIRPWAPLVVFLLLIGLPVAGRIFFSIASLLFGAVGGDEQLAAVGYNQLLFWR